jgi:hypothetical protein
MLAEVPVAARAVSAEMPVAVPLARAVSAAVPRRERQAEPLDARPRARLEAP